MFYSFLVYMLGNCYVLAEVVKKELFFAEHSSCKKEFLESYPWKKRNMERNSFFCRNSEVIPQDSWNWKANKKEHKMEFTT